METEQNGTAARVVLITGAAGGIGGAVASAFAAQGAVVAAVDLSERGLEELTAKLAADAARAVGYPTDLSDRAAVEETVERVERDLGDIGVLVNAAGILRSGPAEEIPEADWRAVFSINVDGVFHCAQAVARRMKPRRHGSIVTIASNASRVPRMHMAAYGASKAAASYYTRTLGLELAEYGIRCNVVSPGSTDTDMLRSLWAGESDRQVTIDGSLRTYKVGIPLRRIAEPADIADAVVFLASDQARNITMEDLCVDGGAVLGV